MDSRNTVAKRVAHESGPEGSPRDQRLVRIGLLVFSAGFLSSITGIQVLPPGYFPPWQTSAPLVWVAWGWLTVGALAAGATLALAAAAHSHRSWPFAEFRVAPDPKDMDPRLWWSLVGSFSALVGVVFVWTYVLGNPYLDGHSIVHWGALAFLVLGVSWMVGQAVVSRRKKTAYL